MLIKKFLPGVLLIGMLGYTFQGCQTSSVKNKEEAVSQKDTMENTATTTFEKGSFGYDLNFVKRYQQVVVLKDKEGKAQVITSPELQGRVLTSTFAGESGKSLGWVNHERVATDSIQPHIQAYGGEDRFWIGPQGGQFTIFFNPGDPFDFDHWFTPSPLDTEPFELVSQTDTSVRYHKKMQLTNYSNTPFTVEVNREIHLLTKAEVEQLPGIGKLDESIQYVGFESRNEMVNAGKELWKKDKGLLSIWILGMFPPSPATTVVIPYKEGLESKLGPVLSEYFVDILGKIPENRLKVNNGHVYYKADGNYASKIGLTPKRAKPWLGSYDPQSKVLTLIHYTLPEGKTDYVNSLWEIQKDPYAGDAVNSYNDGKLDHSSMPEGIFYELESSSSALELKPGQGVTHIHRTLHFSGDETKLDAIARGTLGVGLGQITSQFKY